ncbi:MAG: DUF1559 domain-containing protein [Victivallales bacterium]|nr:DUF1559 domain-containing protein [Victivallales bacterium]
MLLPALNQARERARSTSCISNLKQLGLATGMYANDYNGFLVDTKESSGHTKWLCAGLRPYLGENAMDADFLVAGKTIMICPSEIVPAGTQKFLSGYTVTQQWYNSPSTPANAGTWGTTINGVFQVNRLSRVKSGGILLVPMPLTQLNWGPTLATATGYAMRSGTVTPQGNIKAVNMTDYLPFRHVGRDNLLMNDLRVSTQRIGLQVDVDFRINQ